MLLDDVIGVAGRGLRLDDREVHAGRHAGDAAAAKLTQVAGCGCFAVNGRRGHLRQVAAGDHRKAAFQVLAADLGVFVELHVADAGDHRREAREPTALAGPVGAVQVDDPAGRHRAARGLAQRADEFAGVLVEQPVGRHAAQAVVLDAVDDAAALDGPALRGVKPINLQQLKLQRHRQAVLRGSRADAYQHLAVDFHRPVGAGLQAVEVAQAIGVGHMGPLLPQRVDSFGLGLGRQAARADAGADGTGYQ